MIKYIDNIVTGERRTIEAVPRCINQGEGIVADYCDRCGECLVCTDECYPDGDHFWAVDFDPGRDDPTEWNNARPSISRS